MKKPLITLTPGQTLPHASLTLQAYLPEQQIAHAGLLDGLSAEEIDHHYAPVSDEKIQLAGLRNGTLVPLSAARIEMGMQKRVLELEDEGYEIILLLCSGNIGRLQTRQAVVLESDRLVPPLIAAIVSDHQVGIVVAAEHHQLMNKWSRLSKPPYFAVASPWLADNETLLDAALLLQEQGVDVVVLDAPGYHPRQRDLLQKLLGIPVLLSSMLMVQLATELIM